MYSDGFAALVTTDISLRRCVVMGLYFRESVTPAVRYTSVTCQPFVGLRNRALLGGRRINDSQQNTRGTAARGKRGFLRTAAMTSHDRAHVSKVTTVNTVT
jgi:hypothetical protein